MLALDQALESEGHDRADIALPANQYKLLKQIRSATKQPIIVLLVHGGTLALDQMFSDADAILDAWYDISDRPLPSHRRIYNMWEGMFATTGTLVC
jgi:hypothetical protein